MSDKDDKQHLNFRFQPKTVFHLIFFVIYREDQSIEFKLKLRYKHNFLDWWWQGRNDRWNVWSIYTDKFLVGTNLKQRFGSIQQPLFNKITSPSGENVLFISKFELKL